MKKRFSAFLLSLAMVISSILQPMITYADTTETKNVTVGDLECTYDVILPDGYETSGVSYPVIYVMPEDGLTADKNLTAALQAADTGMDMIMVTPTLTAGLDLHAALEEIVAAVDFEYRTLADSAHRAIVGVGEGGYLAYALGLTAADGTALTAPDLFASIASVRGDFVGKDNEWIESYGDVYTLLSGMKDTLGSFYTYLDAPADDAWSTLDNSSNDIGSLMISYGLDDSLNEFTTRTGEYNEAFLAESASRVADRLTTKMVDGIAIGTVKLAKTALTSDVENAEVTYSASVTEALATFVEKTDIEIVVSVVDPDTNEVLARVSDEQTIEGAGEFKDTIEIANEVKGDSSNVVLSVKVLGTEIELATATLVRVQDTTSEHIDLMGDWYFHFTGNKDGLDVAALTESGEYTTWSVVQPALAWWTQGFGDVTSRWPGAYFDYGIIGDGYYVRTFDVPADFSTDETLILSIGNMDDRGEAYINGQLVGATGMKDGASDGESAWEVYSYYEIDSSILNYGGSNTIVVRNQNDGMGGGGWYAGPVGIYTQDAFDNAGIESRFEEKTFESAYAATALGAETETVENAYLVYLPEDYYESDEYYPTLYLLHQYNSTHKSYMTDDIDALIDEAVKAGILDDMIVVVPNSSEASWWKGDWQKMITEELIPLIDSEYRTIQDARYRLTAGCSMGGQGAMSVALGNPDTFSGAVSFFGALSMPQDGIDALKVAETESVEYLDYYALYFVCGNQDIYKFGIPAITLDKTLTERGVEHEFFIENGAHDSGFYVPFFIEGLAYARNNMYKSDASIVDNLYGTATVDGTVVSVEVNAEDAIEEYLNVIPTSTYTNDTNPDLIVPVTIEVSQDGNVVYTATDKTGTIGNDSKSFTVEFDVAEYVDAEKAIEVTVTCAVLDQTTELKEKEIEINFTDVEEGTFYYDAMVWAVGEEITDGMTETTFVPDGKCTRGQVVTFLWRALGCPETETTENPFTDVEEGRFYYDAVLWAYENGIVKGMSETTFAPEATCTRGQVATFLWRAFGCPEIETTENPFTDVEEGRFYYDAVLWAAETQITKGITETTFEPETTCARSQVVTFLYRTLN